MASLTDRFQVACGTIVGREHVRCHRNNQDGVAASVTDDLIVAAVTDGCSSGRCSEVGARLGAEWLAAWAPVYVARQGGLTAPELPEAITRGLAQYLRQTARRLRPSATALTATVQDFLLFTLQVALVTPETTLVFGIGDGVLAVNGEVAVFEAGVGNAPPYLAYRLVSGALDPMIADVRPVVHVLAATAGIDALLIGTDGAGEFESKADLLLPDGTAIGGLRPFTGEPKYRRNPTLLQKRLTVVGELHRHLSDDTTLALIGRKEG